MKTFEIFIISRDYPEKEHTVNLIDNRAASRLPFKESFNPCSKETKMKQLIYILLSVSLISFSAISVGKAKKTGDSQYEQSSQIFDYIVNIDYLIMQGAAEKSPTKVTRALNDLKKAFPKTPDSQSARSRIQQEEGKEALELWDDIQHFLTQHSDTFSETAKTKPSNQDYWKVASDWRKLTKQGNQYFKASTRRKTPNSQLMADLLKDKGAMAGPPPELIPLIGAIGMTSVCLNVVCGAIHISEKGYGKIKQWKQKRKK